MVNTEIPLTVILYAVEMQMRRVVAYGRIQFMQLIIKKVTFLIFKMKFI